MNKVVIPIQTLATATSMNMKEDSELKAIKEVCTRGGSWRRVDSTLKEHYNVLGSNQMSFVGESEKVLEVCYISSPLSVAFLNSPLRNCNVFDCKRVVGAAREETLNRLPTAATCMNLLKLPRHTEARNKWNRSHYTRQTQQLD